MVPLREFEQAEPYKSGGNSLNEMIQQGVTFGTVAGPAPMSQYDDSFKSIIKIDSALMIAWLELEEYGC